MSLWPRLWGVFAFDRTRRSNASIQYLMVLELVHSEYAYSIAIRLMMS